MGTLVSIDAWNRRTQSRVTVRAGASLNSSSLGAGGSPWEPVIARLPRFAQQLADDDMTGQLMVGTGELAITAKDLIYAGDWRDLDWIGSPVRVYSGEGQQLSDFKTEFVGRITGGVTNADSGQASLAMEVNKTFVDVALLRATYGGGGGSDGDVELRGTYKPAGFGSPVNVRAILIDTINQIYQADAYGNLIRFDGVFEDLASFGASIGDFPTFTALRSASIKEGQWATCNAEGMFRLGATATGVITCDPVCGANLPGSMMLRWLAVHAGLPPAQIRTADFTALTAAVQAITGSPPTMSYWTSEGENVLELMQRVCASCNSVPLIMLDGSIGVARCIGGPVAVTLNRQGGSPNVTAWASTDSPIPWYRLRMPAAKSYYVNSPSEIDYEDDIVDRGDYDSTEAYRQGNVVRWQGDGARYIYVNATASTGIAPPAAGYWAIYQDAPDATQISYPGGGSVYDKMQSLQGQIDATVADNVLSKGEKPQWVITYNGLAGDINSLNQRYGDLGSPADITTTYLDANAKMSALGTYLGSLSPAWNDPQTDTPIVANDFRAAWSNALISIAAFRAAITGRKGDKGEDGADGAGGLPGAPGADGRTTYTHYAYANAPDGSIDFTTASPQARAYEGSYVDFIPADSNDPAAYTWREYKGPPFGMAVRGPAVIAGNSVIKRADSGDAWDADAYSTVGLRNGALMTCQFGAPSYAMAGLNTDPTTNTSWESLDFAWYCDGNTARIYESGVQISSPFEGISPDYIFRIEYDGRYVRYFVNESGPYRTVDAGPGKLFYFDSSLRVPLSKIFNIGFVSIGTVGVDGTPGTRGDDGLPGAPGANGVSSYTAYAYANSPDGAVDFTTGVPGTRGFIGVCANLTSNYEPQTPASYTWSQYRGPPFGVATRGTAVAVGNTILKNGGINDWESDAFSTSGYTGAASVSFTLTNDGAIMAGLNTDPTTDASYTSIDFAFYSINGNVYAYESASNPIDFGPTAASAKLRIDYNGQTVTYYIDDEPRRQVMVGPGITYYFDSSIAYTARIENLNFTGGAQIAPAITLIADTPRTAVFGSSIRGMLPSAGWGSVHAHSRESFANGAVAQWTIPAGSSQQDAMVGLGQAQHNGDSYDGITFAIFQQSDGYYDARVNGNSFAGGLYVNTAVDNHYKLQFDGETIRYFVNSVQFATYPWGRQPDPLFFVAALASIAPRVTNITFSAAGTAGTNGLNGTNGLPGGPGPSGQTTYLHIAYARSADGSFDFTTGAPGDRTYIGVYTDFTLADSEAYQSYSWSLIKGADGLNGRDGTPGAPGANGLPTYVHIAYSNSADGNSNFSLDDPTGRTYVGFYVDQTVADSGNPAMYSWSLVKGQDGTSPFIATVSTTQMTVNATASGATKSDALPKSATLRVKQGATDVTAAASVTLTASPSNLLSMSYANGVLSLNQADGEGYIDVRVSVGAVLVDTIRIAVRRILDSPPAGASSSFESTITTATYDARVTPIMTVSADLNGQLRGEMYVDYDVAAGNGNFNVTLAAKMQYRVANGSGGSDMAAEAVGSTAYKSGTPTGPVDPDAPPPPDPISGSVSFAVTIGGLIAGQNYEVWGLLRRYAGNANARGTGTVTGRKP